MSEHKKIDERNIINPTNDNATIKQFGDMDVLNRGINNRKELTSANRNIKVELRTWNTLKNLKKSNETFNDVILSLLKERTISMGGDNLKAIKYSRRTVFLQTAYLYKSIGVEFEYNDVKKEQTNFNLDLKIKKVFF